MNSAQPESSADNASWQRVELSAGDPAKTRLSLSELREIASACGGPHVSIYLPTHERGDAVQQDPRRLEALLKEAATRLEEKEVPASQIDELLQPARGLLSDTRFWNAGRHGLGVLLSGDQSHVYKLPYAVKDSCFVSDRWRSSPLLPLVEEDRFAVLAFSRAQVRLYAGDRDGLAELPLGGIPTDLESVVGSQPAGASLQWHTGAASPRGARPAVFHGHGAGHDDRDQELERFLRQVAVALPAQLPRPGTPVVLAAVERNVAELRRHASGLRLASEAVLGEPGDASLPKLHASAWECAEPLLRAPIRRAIERIGEQFITARATADLATVLHSSREGRCDVLLVALDAPVWGTFDPSTGEIELHHERGPDDDDLLDLCVAWALERGTEVHALAPDEVPGGNTVAALHRY